MVELALAIGYLYPDAVPLDDFVVSDWNDGQGARIISWNEAKLGPQPSIEQLAAVTSSQVNAWRTDQLREASQASLVRAEATSVLCRAIAWALLSEVNILRSRCRDQDAAVAAAASLADLKSRWAALGTLSDRTLSQARAAIQEIIATGAADD